MKFVRIVATNIAGIGLNRSEFKLHAIQNTLVTAIHFLVGCVEAVLIQMKGVGVLHGEFPRPHDAESWSTFVTELGLNLVKIDGQLTVALHFPTKQIRDYLLVGWSQAKISVVSVLHAQHFVTHFLPAPGFHP